MRHGLEMDSGNDEETITLTLSPANQDGSMAGVVANCGMVEDACQT